MNGDVFGVIISSQNTIDKIKVLIAKIFYSPDYRFSVRLASMKGMFFRRRLFPRAFFFRYKSRIGVGF